MRVGKDLECVLNCSLGRLKALTGVVEGLQYREGAAWPHFYQEGSEEGSF